MTDKPTKRKKFGPRPSFETFDTNYVNLHDNASYDMLLSHGADNRPAAAMKDLIAESGLNNGQPLAHQDFENLAVTQVTEAPHPILRGVLGNLSRQLQQKPESHEHPKLVARLGIPDHMQSFFDRNKSQSKE